MSIDLYVYSNDPTPIPVQDFTQQCLFCGLNVRVLRSPPNWENSELKPEGRLESEDVIYGWSPQNVASAEIERAFLERDCKALERLEARSVFGVCIIEIWGDPAAYNQNLENDAEGYDGEYSAIRLASRIRYSIHVSAGGNDAGYDLQEFVLQRIAELRGGMFDDPQECDFRVVQNHRRTEPESLASVRTFPSKPDSHLQLLQAMLDSVPKPRKRRVQALHRSQPSFLQIAVKTLMMLFGRVPSLDAPSEAVIGIVARQFGMTSASVDARKPLNEYGMIHENIIEIVFAIAMQTGVKISVERLSDYSTGAAGLNVLLTTEDLIKFTKEAMQLDATT